MLSFIGERKFFYKSKETLQVREKELVYRVLTKIAERAKNQKAPINQATSRPQEKTMYFDARLAQPQIFIQARTWNKRVQISYSARKKVKKVTKRVLQTRERAKAPVKRAITPVKSK